MRRLGLLLGALLLARSAAATTFYVATTGDDSRSCATAQTITTPKATLTSGMGCLAAGDMLYVRGGTYDEVLDNVAVAGTSWSSPVRIAAYASETVWLQPTTGTVVVYLGSTQQYIEFDGINLDATAQTALGGGNDLRIEGSATGNAHHIRFKNAELKIGADGVPNQGLSGGGVGVLATQGPPSSLGANEFLNLRVHGGGDAGDFSTGFELHSSSNLIDGCEVYDTAGIGIHLTDAAVTQRDTVVRNSLVHDLTRSGDTRIWGILIDRADSAEVYNTLIYNLYVAGTVNRTSRILWDQAAPTLFNAQIYVYRYYADGATMGGVSLSNVSCSGDASPFSCQAAFPVLPPGGHTLVLTAANGGSESAPSASVSFTVANADGIDIVSGNAVKLWNNTVYASAGAGIRLANTFAQATTVQNNLAWQNGQDYVDNGASTTADHNLFGVDPLFNNAGSNFSLQAGSPARDIGATLAAVTTDIIGTMRPQGSAYDVGAYEGLCLTTDCTVGGGGRRERRVVRHAGELLHEPSQRRHDRRLPRHVRQRGREPSRAHRHPREHVHPSRIAGRPHQLYVHGGLDLGSRRRDRRSRYGHDARRCGRDDLRLGGNCRRPARPAGWRRSLQRRFRVQRDGAAAGIRHDVGAAGGHLARALV
jgi:hypothetical protein